MKESLKNRVYCIFSRDPIFESLAFALKAFRNVACFYFIFSSFFLASHKETKQRLMSAVPGDQRTE